ncbi:MAG: universal stress protein [Verrucomicrobia bacterium]|nr:universal stress protein [Verrucomicrobiota bacterium]
MKKFHRILVGLDLSPQSRNALREAARLAAFDESTLIAYHVIEQELADAIGQSLKLDGAGVIAHIGKSVEHFITDSGVDVANLKCEIAVGHAFVELLKACEVHEIDLLVLGSRGSQHGPGSIGTIAAKCIRKAPLDVLVVKEDITGPHQHIIACVDLSETSAKALQLARRIAEQDGAALDCLYIDQSALALAADYGGYLPALPSGGVSNAALWQKELDTFVEPLLRNSSIERRRNIVMERMSIREAIMEHTNETKATLVTLGTRGKTDLRSLIMGTTAEKIVQHAPCSILAVKPDGFEYHAA